MYISYVMTRDCGRGQAYLARLQGINNNNIFIYYNIHRVDNPYNARISVLYYISYFRCVTSNYFTTAVYLEL